MAKTISYADAVRILGGGAESAVFQRVNNLTGGLLAGASMAVPGLLGLLDLRAELARVSRELIGTASQALVGAGGRDRTERLAAAHTVLVVAAYFEAIEGIDLSWARLSHDDQLRLAGNGNGHEGGRDLTSAVLTLGLAVPEPHVPHAQYLAYLDDFYSGLSRRLAVFLAGLAPWDDLTEGARERLRQELNGDGRKARQRYEALLLDLMADCPDMALWIDRRHQNAVEGRLDSLRELERLLREVATGTGAEALRRAHAALLGHRIVESTDLPDGLDVPTLDRAYLPPAFQVTERAASSSPADEGFWHGIEVRQDIDRFLAGYLGSPRALRAPLLILGQPGAGKSVLTRVLAARLSETRFLPIRVPLRDVDSSQPLQRQIEQAVLAATTEETTWSELVRSTDALPVVILDGFDELLQASGTSQDDFLQKVADFQEREREQGRAAAVIVTSRISVADRAAVPPETLLVRLQPFDEPRIRSWVSSWNDINAAGLAARGCAPLAAEAVLAHRELAGQPLLLLMLALYDSDANALRVRAAGLTPGELYERLLVGFARREVAKAYPHVAPESREPLVEQELSRLAVVAFAMLNRSAQWVAEDAVAQDLRTTLGDPLPSARADQLDPAALLFGRFFFLHRAQAVHGGNTRRTYEFLHATFGEYLVARFTWRLLAETVARDSVVLAVRPVTGNDLMAALLSSVPLTVRAPIVQFLAEMAGHLGGSERRRWAGVVIRMFQQCERDGTWPATAYQPVPRLNVAARFAAYTANLILISVVVSGGLRFGEIAAPAHYEPVRQWHDYAHLWHGQLNNESWGTLVETLSVEGCVGPGGHDVRLGLDDGSSPTPRIDPHWLFRRPEEQRGNLAWIDNFGIDARRRRVLFQGCMMDGVVWHIVEPLLTSELGPAALSFASWWPGRSQSAAQALIETWLLPVANGTTPAQDADACLRALRIVTEFPGWPGTLRDAYANMLLVAVREAPVGAAFETLRRLYEYSLGSIDTWLATATAVMGRLDHGDGTAVEVAELVFERLTVEWSVLSDRRAAMVAAARAVTVARRRRRAPEVTGKLDRNRESAGLDETRGELETFRVRLASLRTTTRRWQEDLNALFDEFSWLAAGSELHASLVALARMPETAGDVDAVLAHVDERIEDWLTRNP